MNRLRILLPAITSASAGLGALMYAGTTDYNCVGRYDNRSIAHPPFPWPWYIASRRWRWASHSYHCWFDAAIYRELDLRM